MSTLKEVVVVDAVRSAIGKSGWKGMEKGGQLCQASAQDLMANTLRGLLERVRSRCPKFNEAEIENVVIGCLSQIGEQGSNIARIAHFGAWLVLVGKRLPVWQVAQSLLYGQLRKTRHQGQVRFNHTRRLVGKRADFRAALLRLGLTGTIQTAFVERVNLTLRESIATLSRRTWSIAYSLDSLRWSIEWGRAYYHFIRPHHSLTIRNDSGRIVRRRTPAMAAGLAHKIWTVQDLLCLPLAP